MSIAYVERGKVRERHLEVIEDAVGLAIHDDLGIGSEGLAVRHQLHLLGLGSGLGLGLGLSLGLGLGLGVRVLHQLRLLRRAEAEGFIMPQHKVVKVFVFGRLEERATEGEGTW